MLTKSIHNIKFKTYERYLLVKKFKRTPKIISAFVVLEVLYFKMSSTLYSIVLIPSSDTLNILSSLYRNFHFFVFNLRFIVFKISKIAFFASAKYLTCMLYIYNVYVIVYYIIYATIHIAD